MHLISHVKVTVQILSGDQIYEQFLPIALRCMAGGAAPTRSAAAGAAVAFLRCMRKPYQRTELLARLLRDFARGRSCSHRLITVDVCHALLRLFSARYDLQDTCTLPSHRHTQFLFPHEASLQACA